jgi:hypothetical protein
VGMLARNTELYASWITVTASYAWLPLVLAGGVLLLRFPKNPFGLLVFSIAAGLLALASPSQAVIHAMLSCVILFATGIARLCMERRFTDVWRVAWSLVAGCGIAFGIAGAAILPMYIATGEMIRHVGPGATVIGYAHIPWKSFNLNQLSFSQAAGILIKPTWIAIVGSPYVGPLGVVGVMLTGIYFRRLNSFLRMLVVAFGVISLYGLLSGFGTNLGLAYVNFHLPAINLIREAGRHLVLFVIGVSFLSGFGYSLLARTLEQYRENHNSRQLIAPAVLMAAFLAVVLWELLHPKLNEREHFLWSAASFWMLALAPITVVLGRFCRLSHYKKMASAALLVSMAAMVIPVRGFSVSQSGFDDPINLLSHRVLQSIAGQIDSTNYRVDFRDTRFDNKFWAMNGSYYGIKSFYNQLTPQPYAQFRFMQMTGIPHLCEMMGARYVLCGPNNSPTHEGAKQILETEGYRLYENPKPMGRLTLVHRVARFAKNQARLEILSKGFDYFSEAYVRPGDFKSVRRLLSNTQALPHAQDQMTKVADQANRSYSIVESDSPALLVLNEWFTPAWKARVNGKKQPTLRVNEWQTGILLPAGKNQVEFEYRPTLFRALAVLNRITLVLTLLFVIFAVVRKSVEKEVPLYKTF